MASTVINYRYPLAGQTLTLLLRGDSASADPSNGAGGDAFTESVTETTGYYSATVTEALSGVYWFQVLLGSAIIDQGWVRIADDVGPYMLNDQVQRAAESNSVDIKSSVASVDTKVDTLLSRVTTTVSALWTNLIAMITGTGASAKFTSVALSNAPTGSGGSGGGEVTGFTSGAISQLTGVIVTGSVPTADNAGFDQPVVAGDDYPSDRPLTINVSGWVGPDIDLADTITLHYLGNIRGTRVSGTWDIPLENVSGTAPDFTIAVVLTSSQTGALLLGEYDIHVYGDWDGDRHSIMGPYAKMRVTRRDD